jgi:cytosine/adenosine deaminase-related metal-dependent hydrolase
MPSQSQSQNVKIDNARFAVTVDPSRRIIRDASILVEDGAIVRVDKAEAMRDVQADRVIDARDLVVTPGLINTHLHISYAHAVRGAWPDDIPMSQFTPTVYGLMLGMDEDEEYATTLLCLTELVKYGTTCVLDPGTVKFLDPCVDAFAAIGMRGVIGSKVIDIPNPMPLPVQTTAEALAVTERVIRDYDGKLGGKIRAWAIPNGCEVASDELHIGLKRLADEYGVGVTMHQSNADSTVKRYVEQYGRRPVDHLSDLGVLGPNVLLSLAVGLDDGEVDTVAETGTCISIVPNGNMKLALGITKKARFPEMLERGVCVSIGTDSANASNLVDTTRAMYLSAVLFKDARQNPTAISSETAFEMATINGARALGLDDQIGSIEVGKRADLVLWDTRRPEWRNLFNPVNQLVYAADGRSVHTVMCDGRILVDAYEMKTVNESTVLDRAQDLGERLIARTNTTIPTKWPVE